MNSSGFWKIVLLIGIILSLIAFILGWIGFGVPDWHAFQRFNGSTQEYYGLWAYCQDQMPLYGAICQRWSTAENQLFNGSRPNFIRTSEGLITTGMIFLSLGLFVAIVAALLPFIAYLATLFAIIAFIFLVVGLPIFGRQSDSFSQERNDASYNKRYGFWLMVPTIVLEFLAILFFLAAAVLYQLFGHGNLASGGFRNKGGSGGSGGSRGSRGIGGVMPNIFGRSTYGGQQKLGQPYVLPNVPYGDVPYRPAPQLFGGGGMMPSLGQGPAPYPYPPVVNQGSPNLLSEYLRHRVPEVYGSAAPPFLGAGSLPQPSIVRAMGQQSVSNVAPAYIRAGEPAGPHFTPIINLSGQTLVGPLLRTA